MIVLDELRDGPSEVTLANRNESIQALLFDGPHEPLGVGIGIRRSPWRLDDVNPRILQESPGVVTPLSVAPQISTRRTRASAIVIVRPTCRMNASSGCGVDPRICTRRVARLMTNTV
jgi:hypothetical protein